MRKLSLLLSTIVVLALLLTACGGEETSTSIPSTNVPPVTVESTATAEMTTTETPSTDLTTTPGVPVTGGENASRASNMIGMTLWNQNNEQVGEVQDLVLDLDNTRVSYLVVNTSGAADASARTVLVPWDSVQLQGGMTTSAGGQQNGFVLLADPEFLNNAPDVDLQSALPGMGQPAGNWDADIRNFWDTGMLPGGPSSTQSADTPSAATAAPEATATATSSSNSSSSGTNQGQGQGVGQTLQGVVLASDVIGSTVMIGVQGQGQGQGQSQATAVATAAVTALPDTTATATTGPSTSNATGNVGTGATEATVEDLIIDPASGDIQFLVIRTADDDTRWIPVPIGFLRWDATSNGFVLMINANALQNAPAFQEDQFPDTSTTGWDTEFSTFWQNNGTGATGVDTVTVSTATATP